VPEGAASAADSFNPTTELLERSGELAALERLLTVVLDDSSGRFAFVAGEAGAGKSMLLRRFCEQERPSVRILWGACDALFMPRPLGPLLDVAEVAGGELGELVEGSPRPYELAAALMRELARRPTVLVLEDLHWADEATLDVLKLLARRIATTRTLVVASYRDDELDREHALRIVMGELTTYEPVERLRLEPFSVDAVAELAEPHAIDAKELYRVTGGNPFFVTEVLAASGERIPPTVKDAVLARAARLDPVAKTLLDAAAIVPNKVEPWLLEALVPGSADALEKCLASGMLVINQDGVAFRHELARLALEEALMPIPASALHRTALAALGNPPAGNPDPARLAHHAEAAGDGEAVVRHAPVAANRASAVGAHRESAAQYSRVLRFAGALPADERADLLEARAYECYLTDQLETAIEAQQSALLCRREAGDALKEGDALRSLARLLGFVGRTYEAADACREAVAILEQLPPGRELAMAYGKMAQRCLNWEDVDGAVEWGTRTLELARRLDDTEALVYALTTLGAAELRTASSQGIQQLDQSVELAKAAGLEDHVGRAFTNLIWLCVRQRSFDVANRYLVSGLKYCEERGLDYWRLALLGCRARLELDQGRWTEAARSASVVLSHPRRAPVPRVLAGVVQGLVRARRGEPDVWPLLDAALAHAAPTGELQQIAPVAAARAEAAWLEGRHRGVAEATDAALELALRCPAPWEIGDLASWRSRAGVSVEMAPTAVARPFALQLSGDGAQAAELWAEIGCPYESALARGDTDDEGVLRRALDELKAMGAAPAAAIVARRLRRRGARGVPRGPRPSSRQNPANLTRRELDVLRLVAEGLRNAEIAERLFLSTKTVDHHVSSILRKLGMRTRGEASAEARRLGLVGQDRES
jgi:DNA-binding CsgD family transcriptional regulator/tetratricopeptide (TPR) repeat protein